MANTQTLEYSKELQEIFAATDMKWSTKTGHRVRVFPVSIFRFVWG